MSNLPGHGRQTPRDSHADNHHGSELLAGQVTLAAGRSKLGAAKDQARGSGGPSTPNGPNRPLRGSESAK
eukprot:14885679-Alexandrium_andersonii.AAC.1